jgi:hypothetical protein
MELDNLQESLTVIESASKIQKRWIEKNPDYTSEKFKIKTTFYRNLIASELKNIEYFLESNG